MRRLDVLGRRFGRLLVVGPTSSKGGRLRWLCSCDCGERAFVTAHCLVTGMTRSCGCLHRESAIRTGRWSILLAQATRVTHGLTRGGNWHPLYAIWRGMKQRCNDPNHGNYRYYGGRGIRICARWRNFALFVADMGPRPTPHHTVDRIDNDGNYEPGNVRWATWKEQNASGRRRRLA